MLFSRALSITLLAALVGCSFDVDGNRDENFSELGRPDLGPGAGGGSGQQGSTGGGASTSGGAGSSGGSTTPTGTASFALTTSSDALSGELYDVKSLEISVTPSNGFAAPVTLSVEGAGANVEFKLDKTTISPGEKAILRVFSTNGGASNFSIKAISAGVADQTKALTFTASKILTMRIKNGTQATPNGADNWSSGPADFRTAPMSIFKVTNALPLQVKVVNDDTTGHIVHGAGAFTHGDTANPVPANGTDPQARNLAAAGTFAGYEHVLGAGTRNFSIQIVN